MKNSSSDILEPMIKSYLWVWTFRDERVDGLPLMSSIQPVIWLIGLYAAILYFGPKLMQNRKPFQLNRIMILYNISISLYNLYIVLLSLTAVIRLNYNWVCEANHPYDRNPEEIRLITANYLYVISKPMEWLDTIFFILRKNNRQLSVLHIYHHVSVLIVSWVTLRWASTGSTFSPILLNSIVHVIMYNYYALSAFGPRVKKYLWWKKYLTIIQLIQFALNMLQGVSALLTNCRYPKWSQYSTVMYNISFLVLFSMFYYSAYITSKKMKITATANIECEENEQKAKVLRQNVINQQSLRSRTIVANF